MVFTGFRINSPKAETCTKQDKNQILISRSVAEHKSKNTIEIILIQFRVLFWQKFLIKTLVYASWTTSPVLLIASIIQTLQAGQCQKSEFIYTCTQSPDCQHGERGARTLITAFARLLHQKQGRTGTDISSPVTGRRTPWPASRDRYPVLAACRELARFFVGCVLSSSERVHDRFQFWEYCLSSLRDGSFS